MIQVDGVSKTFSFPDVRRETLREHVFALFRPRHFRDLTVLDAVSFEVKAGETVGIMGRNGSGKSTLLKIIAGIYPPDRGTARVRGALTPILELGVGWNPELDAIDNIYLLGSVMGLGLGEIRAGIDEILAFAELAPFANLKLKHYSSGMAARLAYSVAFKAVREVLILDEIFAVGDAGFVLRCEERYRELSAAGRTILLVSHDPKAVATFCERALLLERGRILLDGPAKTVADRYLELLTAHGDAGPAPVS
jgi:ABC-type polysaccharide/polyol phosphate transport system ATPase subunit